MRQQARSEETRNKILDAARICFSRSGYEAASVDNICEQAGITKGAFYYHFESKLALFLELDKIWLSRFEEFILKSQDRQQASIAEYLINIRGLFQNVFTDTKDLQPMVLEMLVESTRNPLVRKDVIDKYRYYLQILSQMIEAGRADGSIETDDPDLAALTIISISLGMMILGLLDPQTVHWDVRTQESILLLLKALRHQK